MIISFLRVVMLFSVPFLIYGLLAVMLKERLLGRYPLSRQILIQLSFIGLILAIVGNIIAGQYAPRYFGPLVPSRIEGNKLIPGYIE